MMCCNDSSVAQVAIWGREMELPPLRVQRVLFGEQELGGI